MLAYISKYARMCVCMYVCMFVLTINYIGISDVTKFFIC